MLSPAKIASHTRKGSGWLFLGTTNLKEHLLAEIEGGTRSYLSTPSCTTFPYSTARQNSSHRVKSEMSSHRCHHQTQTWQRTKPKICLNTNTHVQNTDLKMKAHVYPKRWYPPTSPHGVTNHVTNTNKWKVYRDLARRSMFVEELTWRQ